MGFAQYAKVSGDQEARGIAKATYANILRRRDNPKGIYLKQVPGTRPLKGLSLPMILVNLARQMEGALSEDEMRRGEDACIAEIMDQFLDPDTLLMREAIHPDGKRSDSFEGRLLNPGHGIEAMWFVMDVARRRGDMKLANRALDVVLATLKFAWDKEYGGIFYFMDAAGKPLDKLEHDQKLWWVHAETLVALAMGWGITNRPACREWYERVHEYTWKRFPDPKHGEWFGYLNRRGEVSIPLKGGKWKGCFHIPRALYLCWKEFAALAG
jgi:N-acylglucosamine 2-epimerase